VKRDELRSRNRRAIVAARKIHKLATSDWHRTKEHGPPGSDPVTFGLMLDKADKTTRAILLLATRGYVEDAFILARSLVNLTIDISYLSTKDSDRFESYRATGKIARRRMARLAGVDPIDEEKRGWRDAKQRAERWQKPGAIFERAEKSGCVDLYKRAYRHGSSYEHSDAWSLLTFEHDQGRAREVVFHLVMLVIVYSVVKTYHAWAQFSGRATPSTEERIKGHFFAAFRPK